MTLRHGRSVDRANTILFVWNVDRLATSCVHVILKNHDSRSFSGFWIAAIPVSTFRRILATPSAASGLKACWLIVASVLCDWEVTTMVQAPEDASPRLTVQDGALLGAGMLCVSGAAMFYRQKRTRAFKIAYALSWPILGTAVISAFSPRRKEMEESLQRRGVDKQWLETNRELTALQLNKLRSVAEQGKQDRG
jgi:hypothetical protein